MRRCGIGGIAQDLRALGGINLLLQMFDDIVIKTRRYPLATLPRRL
jgi:hypothetical protein